MHLDFDLRPGRDSLEKQFQDLEWVIENELLSWSGSKSLVLVHWERRHIEYRIVLCIPSAPTTMSPAVNHQLAS